MEGVYRVGDDQVLRVRLAEGHLPVGSEVTARVDEARRRQTQANHTATHVLSWALRETLGQGVRQAGSYVGPDKLRFDFTHRGRVEPETLREIERMVNRRVDEDQPVSWEVMSRDEAAAEGAIGLFEEKYGERVRVLSTGDFSKELCGGTHVSRTGEIGPFTITGEASSAPARAASRLSPARRPWSGCASVSGALLADLAQRDERIRALEGEVRWRSQAAPTRAPSSRRRWRPARCACRPQVEALDMDELLAISIA